MPRIVATTAAADNIAAMRARSHLPAPEFVPRNAIGALVTGWIRDFASAAVTTSWAPSAYPFVEQFAASRIDAVDAGNVDDQAPTAEHVGSCLEGLINILHAVLGQITSQLKAECR